MSSASHQNKIFIASFLTLIAAGVGFAVRGAILDDWAAQFGFTKADLGEITGFGLAGFGVTIIICSFFADKVGYKALLAGAFVLHLASGIITLCATPVFNASGRGATYWCLSISMLMFALGNGLCEAVINPLVATLYPRQKTHYLNILHAGWPGGLILGGLLAYAFAGPGAAITHLRWEIPMAFFLVPTVAYGILAFPEKFPISEARAAGVGYSQMLKEFAAPLLLFLLFIHALVGYVELGTDSWITNIMNNVIAGRALLLFVYTSGIMFVLRFFGRTDRRTHQSAGAVVRQRTARLYRAVLAWLRHHRTGDLSGRHRLRRGQDVPLADDAGSGGRTLPTRRGDGDGHHRRHRHAVGRLTGRARHRLCARLLRLAVAARQIARRLRAGGLERAK